MPMPDLHRNPVTAENLEVRMLTLSVLLSRQVFAALVDSSTLSMDVENGPRTVAELEAHRVVLRRQIRQAEQVADHLGLGSVAIVYRAEEWHRKWEAAGRPAQWEPAPGVA